MPGLFRLILVFAIGGAVLATGLTWFSGDLPLEAKLAATVWGVGVVVMAGLALTVLSLLDAADDIRALLQRREDERRRERG